MANAKDPICGMAVDMDRAKFKGSFEGKMVYFCSAGCQQTYAKAHKSP